MYRLMIVDDEPDIVEGLEKYLARQEDLELEIAKAYSGVEALERMQTAQTDIMLLDINMPGMTGLQLLEKIRETWPRCWVIFVTGYDEFDYVYTAMKYDRVSYILKTEEHEVIKKAVQHAQQELKESLYRQELAGRAEEQMRRIRPILQREFLLDLLEGTETDAPAVRRNIGELGIGLTYGQPFLLLLGRIDGDSATPALESERTRLLYSLQLMAEGHFGDKLDSAFAICSQNLLAWLIQPGEFFRAQAGETWDAVAALARESAERIQTMAREAAGLSMTFLADNRPTSWEEAAARFNSLRNFLYMQIGFRSNMLYYGGGDAASESGKPDKAPVNVENARLKLKKIPLLEASLENGRQKELHAQLLELFEGMEALDGALQSHTLELLGSISLVFLSYINRWNLTDKFTPSIDLDRLTGVRSYKSPGNALEYFTRLSDMLFDLRRREEEDSTSQVIGRVLRYIDENCDKELSLVRLADVAHFNPSYLARLFKQHTGRTLLSYVNDTRLTRAKTLLENPNVKIQDIGASTGFSSASYFAQFFRKETGMSPQEYRDSRLKISQES